MGGTKRSRGSQNSAASLSGSSSEGERCQSFRAVGALASKLAAPIVANRGGGILVRLKAEWAAIIGPDWSEVTWPVALGRDGVLKLRVATGSALELQHRAPLVIERINQFFGRCAVTRLALSQGPLPLPAGPADPLIIPLAPGEAKTLEDRLSAVADPDLRDALGRLGRIMKGREG